MNHFYYLAWNCWKKFFGGHTPALILVQYITPPSPSEIFVSTFIFLYIAYSQFVTILIRSFYHWDGFKNYPRKISKNRICQHGGCYTAGGHSTSSHHPDSLDTTLTPAPAIPIILLHHQLSISYILYLQSTGLTFQGRNIKPWSSSMDMPLDPPAALISSFKKHVIKHTKKLDKR